MRTPSLIALSLLVLGAPAATYAADAPATCLGQTATIVGGDGLVTGTEGADVIVASGISTVDALGGDDLVCLEVGSVVLGASEEGPVAKVNAGAGDDVVSSVDLDAFWVPNGGESRAWEAIVALGTGEDQFLGGSAVDMVYGSDPDSADTERDDINTGGGPDYVHSGRSSAANDDVVRTGPGSDVVIMVPPSPAGVLDVRRGLNYVVFDLTAGVPTHWRLDVADRTIHRGTGIGTWAGDVSMWEFDADDGDANSTFTMSGSDHWENVVLWGGIDQFATTVKLGGGPDELYAYGKAEEPGTYALGQQRDTLHVAPLNASLDRVLAGVRVSVDLEAGRLDYGSGPAASATMISGVEDVSVSGTRVRVLGDRQANWITADGCDARVRAGDGADQVSVVVRPYWVTGCAHTSRIEGGPGSDKLFGADKSADLLLGGHGRDLADGNAGIDTCRAEITRHCEES